MHSEACIKLRKAKPKHLHTNTPTLLDSLEMFFDSSLSLRSVINYFCCLLRCAFSSVFSSAFQVCWKFENAGTRSTWLATDILWTVLHESAHSYACVARLTIAIALRVNSLHIRMDIACAFPVFYLSGGCGWCWQGWVKGEGTFTMTLIINFHHENLFLD